MNIKQLKTVSKYYMKILKIRDWNIDIEIVRSSQMDEVASCGQCLCTPEERYASIFILDEKDYEIISKPPYDMELTLVHELCHVSLWNVESFTRCKDNFGMFTIFVENHIDSVSCALVAARRESHRFQWEQ